MDRTLASTPLGLDTALDRYLVQLEADGRSRHTIGQYRRHVRLLAAWLGERGHGGAVDLIDHEDLARFLAAPVARTRPDGGAKRATSTNALRSSIRTFFSYLHDAGYIGTNPARLVRRARCGTAPPRGIDDGESAALMAALERGRGEAAERDHALIHLLLATGIRVGSAVTLHVDDVELRAGVLQVRTTKGDRPETVYLGEKIREHLAVFIGDRTVGPLFAGRDGGRLTTRHVHRRLAHWASKAGIVRAISPHALRHTFATKLYAKCGDIHLVQRALRHRSIASTLVYARCDEQRLRDSIEA